MITATILHDDFNQPIDLMFNTLYDAEVFITSVRVNNIKWISIHDDQRDYWALDNLFHSGFVCKPTLIKITE